MRVFGRGLLVCFVALSVLMPARSEAAPITVSAGTLTGGSFGFGGTFGTDNDVALIFFSLLGASVVTADITSHLATPAGFDPILTLFRSGTDFLGSFDYVGDSDTGSFQGTLAAGAYIFAVTQYNNYYTPFNGFDYDAAVNGLFTSDLFGPAAGCTAFVAFDGSCRTSQFAGTLTVPAPQPVPEPASLALTALGGLWLVAARRRRKRADAPVAVGHRRRTLE